MKGSSGKPRKQDTLPTPPSVQATLESTNAVVDQGRAGGAGCLLAQDALGRCQSGIDGRRPHVINRLSLGASDLLLCLTRAPLHRFAQCGARFLSIGLGVAAGL